MEDTMESALERQGVYDDLSFVYHNEVVRHNRGKIAFEKQSQFVLRRESPDPIRVTNTRQVSK